MLNLTVYRATTLILIWENHALPSRKQNIAPASRRWIWCGSKAFQNKNRMSTASRSPPLEFETFPLTPRIDASIGATSHIFQPPPSAATSLQSSSIRSLSLPQNRKRNRHDSYVFSSDTGSLENTSDARPISGCKVSHQSLDQGIQSPLPLANDTYRLAGGLDTPLMKLHQDQHDLRLPMPWAGRGSGRSDPDDTDLVQTPSIAAETGNNLYRARSSPNIKNGIGNAVYRFAGVAGKLWQNWSSTFRGFYAGGGQGYRLDAPEGQSLNPYNTLDMMRSDEIWCSTEFIPPTPGGFPHEDFIADYMCQDHIQAERRPTKRSRTDGKTTAGWVMVASTASSRENSPSRTSHRKVPQKSHAHTRTTPNNMIRKPITPISNNSQRRSARSPRRTGESASFASPRSLGTMTATPVSPATRDMQRRAARIKRTEAEEDANLKRFNQQLKAMIREGKEALGATFEVEDIRSD